MTAAALAVGAHVDLSVDPKARYFPTGIQVNAGERYAFTASGRWRDGFKDAGPEGWGAGWVARFNRLPGRPFFLLCGTVGQDDALAFEIGVEHKDWQVPAAVAGLADRQLYLFANDWWAMYWNNKALEEKVGGPLRVRITRLV
jgi:hypothetical protein